MFFFGGLTEINSSLLGSRTLETSRTIIPISVLCFLFFYSFYLAVAFTILHHPQTAVVPPVGHLLPVINGLKVLN